MFVYDSNTKLFIERVQACTRSHFAFALCCQNATSGSAQSRPPD